MQALREKATLVFHIFRRIWISPGGRSGRTSLRTRLLRTQTAAKCLSAPRRWGWATHIEPLQITKSRAPEEPQCDWTRKSLAGHRCRQGGYGIGVHFHSSKVCRPRQPCYPSDRQPAILAIPTRAHARGRNSAQPSPLRPEVSYGILAVKA